MDRNGSRLAIGTLAVSLALAVSVSARAEGWSTYKAEKYGFAMLSPPAAKFVEKELGGGWAGLVATHEHLILSGLAKLGEPETPEAIQKFGVQLTKIGADHWKMIDEGKDSKGWKWFRTVKAEHEGHVVFGGYGVGPMGNYLMLLTTTTKDFAAHEADYKAWYKSIELSARAEGWSTYKAEKYGFAMLSPPAAKFVEKELGGGWAGLVATHEHLILSGLAKLGEPETPEAIQKFGVQLTKIGDDHWKMIDEGKDSKGWKWFRTVKAEHEGHVVFGGYGVGPKGNYLMLLTTTTKDFAAHEGDYKAWYKSIELQ